MLKYNNAVQRNKIELKKSLAKKAIKIKFFIKA